MYIFLIIIIALTIFLFRKALKSDFGTKTPEARSTKSSGSPNLSESTTKKHPITQVNNNYINQSTKEYSDLYFYEFDQVQLDEWYNCYAAIDFETAMPARNSACAVGIVLFDDQKIIKKFYSLIKPPNNLYSIHNIRVHGIQDVHTQNSPTFFELYPKLSRLLVGKRIVAHNASFDIDVYNKSAIYYGIEPLTLNLTLDTFRHYGQKLSICCAERGIPLNHHNAVSDAEACALLAIDAFIEIKKENEDFDKRLEEKIKLNQERKAAKDALPKDERVFDKSNPFFGKVVAITGSFGNFEKREYLISLLDRLGADVKEELHDGVNILLKGTRPAKSVMDTADNLLSKGYQLFIYDEEEMLSYMNGIRLDEYIDGNFNHFEFIEVKYGRFSYVSGSKIRPRKEREAEQKK